MTVVETMQPAQKRWLLAFLGAYGSVVVALLACLLINS